MDEVSISLNNIRNIKTVNIEGLGVVKVRRLGAGEELDLSFKLRRLGKLISALSKVDFMQFNGTDPGDVKKIAKLNKRVDEISDEIAEIKTFELQTYKRCFSDDNNGTTVNALMDTLTQEERTELFKQIFGEKTKVELTDTVTPTNEDETKEEKTSE